MSKKNSNNMDNLSKLATTVQERYIIAQKLISLEKQIAKHTNIKETFMEIM